MPRNVLTDKIDKNYRYDWTLADKISHGWRKAFGRQLFEELKEELVRWDYLYDFRFIQIKEKYGSLRLYSNGIPDGSNILEILDKYESLSETICERCEKLKQMIINYRGWYQCICDSCLNQNENRLLKDARIKKTIDYKTFAEL